MLRSGIDPDAVESEIIPAGKRVVAKEEAARDTGVGTRDVVAVRAMGARDMGVGHGHGKSRSRVYHHSYYGRRRYGHGRYYGGYGWGCYNPWYRRRYWYRCVGWY